MLHRIAAADVPHLKRDGKIGYLASIITAQSGKEVGAGTVKDWWYALDDDERGVDSRHMDWARARDRSMAANDNRIGLRATRDCLPSSPTLIAA